MLLSEKTIERNKFLVASANAKVSGEVKLEKGEKATRPEDLVGCSLITNKVSIDVELTTSSSVRLGEYSDRLDRSWIDDEPKSGRGYMLICRTDTTNRVHASV